MNPKSCIRAMTFTGVAICASAHPGMVPAPMVEICVGRDPALPPTVIFRAEAIAWELFHGIGVDVRFETGAVTRGCHARDGHAESISMSITRDAPSTTKPGALATSYPFADTKRIDVFYDRFDGVRADFLPVLLGYVMTHEITHVLQGVCRHSKSGVMKARWDASDNALMKSGRLGFDSEDAGLIYLGLAAHETGDAAAELLVRSNLLLVK